MGKYNQIDADILARAKVLAIGEFPPQSDFLAL